MQNFAQNSIKQLRVFLLGAVLCCGVACADVPGFVKETLYSPNAAPISKIVSSDAADVVILDGGLEQGIRLGMACRIVRGLKEVGELVIIESKSDRSAGLILELSEDTFIQAGDVARIKTLQNS